MLESNNHLVTPCHFRADGVYCKEGFLYYTVKDSPVLLEDGPVTCTACEGKGVILTERGKELITFFQTFLRPMIYEICSDYLDDKMDFPS